VSRRCSLLNALADRPASLALVLDDYHVIEAPAIHRALAWLIDHLPPQFHLLIVSRADPPLPLGCWQARGQLCEVRVHDLRFTLDEAAALLAGTISRPIDSAEVAALDARVEGWAAGLQLAALALRGQADLVARIAAFSGRHEYVLSYLVDDVIAGQPEYVQHFLLRTAILDRLSAPLCDAVIGAGSGDEGAAIPTSRFILDYLRECNLFLVLLDDEGTWFRYHHLFRDVLRHRLRQTDSARVPELHRRAAAWHAAQRTVDTAIQHALAAGDHLLDARWIEQAVDATLHGGDIAPMRVWLAALAERWHPATVGMRVAAFRARMALAAGRVKEVARWAVEASARVGGPYSDLGEIEHLALVRIWIAQGRTSEARELLAQLEQSARAGGRHGRLIEILALRALGAQAAGDPADASATLAEALALGQPEGYVRVFADEGVAMGNLVRGWWRSAVKQRRLGCGPITLPQCWMPAQGQRAWANP
jgi:LuxR family maltose regulon positive regulatory protein